MPKRKKGGSEWQQRKRARERMRERRRNDKTDDGLASDDVSKTTVPCGTVDEAVMASPSNVLGQVSMGFPLKEEKPLARVQASPRVKMHPPAPRLPPPRGSRLFVREQDKAPSPDSPAWVCAPPRAPGPDPVHGSGPAGQAQLEGSRMECTSRILKDGGFKTISKQYSERITNSILNEQNVLETIYENENNDVTEIVPDSCDNEDEPNARIADSCWQNTLDRGNYESKAAAIYLDHKGQNHYNVVVSVSEENMDTSSCLTSVTDENMAFSTENKPNQNDGMNKGKRKSKRISGKLNSSEKRRQLLREKYREDELFREKKLKAAFEKYIIDDEFRANVKMTNVERYKNDPAYRFNIKRKLIDKYATDPEYRNEMKLRSTRKYAQDEQHKQDVKRRSVRKYAVDEEHREHVKKQRKLKYDTDKEHKNAVKNSMKKMYRENEYLREKKLSQAAKRYKTDKEFQSKSKSYSNKQYNSSPKLRTIKKERVKRQRNAKQEKLKNVEELIKAFKEKAKQGIDYSCCCCERLLFQNQVQKCERDSYSRDMNATNVADLCIQEKFCHQCSESCPVNCTKYRLWICYTCHRKIMSGKIPAESAVNNLGLETIPKELMDLNFLEKHLIALHIPFMKVMALPHGNQRNIHGPVVCVPSDLRKVNNLPMKKGEDLLLRVKLKRKLKYKGYHEYQFVNPKHIHEALAFLKQNNYWYEHVSINTDCNDNDEQEIPEEIDEEISSENGGEPPEENEVRQDVNELHTVASDTCLQPVDIAQEVLDHYFDDIYDIAPGEGNNPVRLLQEYGNEAKTFPYLFPSGRFSWSEQRETRITLSRYFNNRLMNSDDRFAKDSNYIFFSQFVSDLNQVIEKTQISIRKCLGSLEGNQPVTSSMVQNPEVLSRLMKNDEALRFMQPIRGTPAYWSSAQKDLFAMLRQLGIPTWFCSFSAAEHRWNDAVASILKHQNDNRDPTSLDWSDKNEILRTNPVTVARMFEHRFHVFQTEVIFSKAEPIGKVTDYFQRVEFQQRGSPHMHCLYWIENAPKLDQDGEETVCDFIDKYVSCAVPSEIEDEELRSIVLAVQQHSKKHSKSCRKKGSECRFNFPRPPSVNTFINSPQEEGVSENDPEVIDLKREQLLAKQILLSVWNEVQDLDDSKTTEDIFNNINLTQEQYEEAHKRLAKKRSIVLQRNPDELWINQYNPCLLKCWDANMDIQFVLDPFSCIVYIVSYISKSEREMGMLLRQTKIEAEEGNESARSTLKKIGSAYLNHREVGAQEAVYRVCNLKMKECSRKVVFIPVGENTTRLTKPLSQLKRKASCECDRSNEENEGDEDESDIWMTNIVERYENRPDDPLFQDMCLAEFCSEFRVLAKSQIPKTPNENVFELKNSKGFIQRRTRSKPAIIRYPRFSVEKLSEKYYQCHLQLFLPYRTKAHLKPPSFDLYQTFYDNGHVKIRGKQDIQSVKNVVDTNHARFAQNEDIIAEAQEAFENIGEPEDAWANLCPESEKMRHECSKPKLILNENEELPDMQDDTNSDVLFKVQQSSGSREEILPVLQSLNTTQLQIFCLVREWCLEKVFGRNPESLHIFITGGAGTGKSHLIKAIHYESSRILSKILSVPDGVSVVLGAFTGTAAFNIGGNTLHHLFSLPKFMPLPYEPLREQSLSEMRVQLGDLQVLIIDEISMVYKRLLYYVHERLVQIKKCKKPFGGITVIAVGDFYQLPPVKQRKDERLYKENAQYSVDYWIDLFKVVELTEIMRQREDVAFATSLNSLRNRLGDQPMKRETTVMLNDCIREGPEDALHVYATNEEVNEYNLTMLRKSCDDLVEIDAQDFKKDSSSGNLKLISKPMTKSRTDGLCSSLLLGLNARVMLTRNCNVDDGLVNGVMGHVSRFVYGQGSAAKTVLAVEVIFDNMNVGKKTGKKTRYGNSVLIERVQEDIQEKKSTVRHQFPLRLSWACTSHKVQGMTVDKVVVNLDRCFAAGQGYVALSRVTSKNGLFIETRDPKILQRKIYADSEVRECLQKMPPLTLPEFSPTSNEGIKILLHNIQSLNKHYEDLRKDVRFRDVDVICLTETWTRSGQDFSIFSIDGYQFHHVSRGDVYDNSDSQFSQLRKSKGGGVAIYLKNGSGENVVQAIPMPKRKKGGNDREQRKRNRERMREKRRKAVTDDGLSHPDVLNSTVPCGTVDEAITASPSNVLGQVSMGFPLKEEKPLARVRASLREKMHPTAPRLPPPRGSRLFVRNEGKAPSPDSPPWVCAPPRAPGPDPVHGSGPAGQAQLEGSREECTSRILKDGGFKTISKQYSERITNSIMNEQNVLESIYENENNDVTEIEPDFNVGEEEPNASNEDSCWQNTLEQVNDELTSVILPNSNLDYTEFNALPLDEALQVALADTDGCFVCFGGNTMLIGKTGNHFFTFDPHARNNQENKNVSSRLASMNRQYMNFDAEYKPDQKDELKKGNIKRKSKRISGMLIAAKKRRQTLRQKYQKDELFRERKLKDAFVRYNEDDEFRANANATSKERYKTDAVYRFKTKTRVIETYSQDEVNKQKIRKASIESMQQTSSIRTTLS
uniref:ATP-dependent DNA helicase n=1 Tax=Crassostrea virginica TaxID=6565 RepID=A0A8B8C799_CRAVI|nr:uncharacterized protein LOC111116305 [Crassostrea virginica]